MKLQEKIIVGFDTAKETAYNVQVITKQNAFKELLSYCEEYVSQIDREAFFNAPLDTFKATFNTEHSKGFSKLISYEKRLEMSSISIDKLQALERQFKGIDIELNIETLEPINEPNFNIYITDAEKIAHYQKGEFLLEKLDELKAKGIEANPVQTMRVFPDLLQFDYAKNQLKPIY